MQILDKIDDDIAAARRQFAEKGSIPTGEVRAICRKHYKAIRGLERESIWQICHNLLESGGWEKRTIAFELAHRLKRYLPGDFQTLYNWLQKHVAGWGSCDDLCTHAFGSFLLQYPEYFEQVRGWTQSDNQWLRRAAAVVLIYGIRRGRFLDKGLIIADLLLEDNEDLVRKGYGWMLKEISNQEPELVFSYVMERKDRMPRVSLRYAIEKLEGDKRKKAME